MCDIPRGLPLDRLSMRYVKLSLHVQNSLISVVAKKTNNNRKKATVISQ